jgi:hypothetical protein
VAGDFGSPFGNVPLAGPGLPALPASPDLAAPSQPSTTNQNIDTTGKTAAPSTSDLASAIAALAR